MKVLDLGYVFGFPVASIFPSAEQLVPSVLDNAFACLERVSSDTLVMFGGGEDVHPELYKHKVYGAYVGRSPSYRDRIEQAMFKLANDKGCPILGICRGSQFVCVMAGGSLVQDVTGHTRTHELVDLASGEKYTTTSTHHQMQYPFNVDHKLVAITDGLISGYYTGDRGINCEVIEKQGEPEIVYYPKIRALAVQGHPEYLAADNPFVKYVRQTVAQYLF